MWRDESGGGSASGTLGRAPWRGHLAPGAVAPRPARQPRILILSASTGSGHLRAAEAIRRALGELCPAAFVRHIDALSLATRAFRRCYGGLYLDFIDSHPLVLKYFYTCMDEPRPVGNVNGWDRLRLLLERLNLRPLLSLVRSEPWDLIVNTHFLPGELVGCLRRRGEIATPQVVVTTDFETHRLWITEPCEHYFTATEEGALYLERMGIPAGRTTVSGIPVDPVLAAPKGRDGCRARHGLRGDRPVVLQMAGGNGVGPVERVYQALLEVEVPLDLVVITGRNAAAKERLAALPGPEPHRVKVLGFTRQVDELMRAADLVVTKPGGLTVSEALAAGLPLVIVDPVPGQEERNSDYLLENGAAIKCSHPPTLAYKLTALLRDPARLAGLRANARRLGRPRAAFEVARFCLALLLAAAPGPSRRG
jgi:processive 1,2-diacylglycerol beta-glucosyltransferase